MKKWMAMLLIVALALVQMGAALAQEMPEGGLTVAIKRAAMRASWQGETADNARWLVVEVTLTNWGYFIIKVHQGDTVTPSPLPTLKTQH